MTAPAAPPATTEPGQLTKETYRGRIHPDWCPGCGDFSVLAALQTALFALRLQPHQVFIESAGLRQHLRNAHAPWPRASGCDRRQTWQPRTEGDLRWRRRRRLRNWRKP